MVQNNSMAILTNPKNSADFDRRRLIDALTFHTQGRTAFVLKQFLDLYWSSDLRIIDNHGFHKALKASSAIERRTYLFLSRLFRRADVTYRTYLPTKSDSDVMFCIQSSHGLFIDRSLVY